jgi:ankyrin repeat protein
VYLSRFVSRDVAEQFAMRVIHINTQSHLILNKYITLKMDTHSCNDLLEAAIGGHESCVRELLAAGADPNVADNHGNTPLRRAAYNGHEACVRVLIAAGVDPNVVDDYGYTPLLEATWNGHDACIQTLVESGADPNAVNDAGYTSLHWAVYNNHEACVAALIATGADPNIVNNLRQTPLQLAVRKGHRECMKILIIRILADRDLTDDEWGLVPEESDIGHLLPVVMVRDGRDAAAKLVARLPKEKQKVLETASMCLSRVVSRDVAEQIMMQCV